MFVANIPPMLHWPYEKHKIPNKINSSSWTGRKFRKKQPPLLGKIKAYLIIWLFSRKYCAKHPWFNTETKHWYIWYSNGIINTYLKL